MIRYSFCYGIIFASLKHWNFTIYISTLKQREKGQWTVSYTSPSSFIYNTVFLFVDPTTLGTIMNFDWLVYWLKCQRVSTNICNLKKR